tara:strand:- start:83 stop:925 length:843 start_codon:yes stop_codon:yes gene_type:complete
MDNDIDLLETNRFIKLDIVDQDVDFLNTNDRYIDFLKKTERKRSVDETIENDLLVLDNADNDVVDIDDIETHNKDNIDSFAHEIDTVFSIDSRFRNRSSYANAYNIGIFLEKEFSFLDLIQLLDIYIPHVSNVSGMTESNSSQPVPYLFMKMKIESFPDNILNTIITPISDSTIDSTVSIFAKIGLSIRNDGKKVYDRIIYGSKNFNDTLSVVRAASAIRIEILGMDGKLLNSVGLSPAFESDNGNNWNMTIRFVEKIRLLKKLNINSVRSVNIDPRAGV